MCLHVVYQSNARHPWGEHERCHKHVQEMLTLESEYEMMNPSKILIDYVKTYAVPMWLVALYHGE